MAKQKVFTRANISEFLNTDKTYYKADGFRQVGLCKVSFTYVNTLNNGERLTVDFDGVAAYKHATNDPAFMFNGITNALRAVNKFIEQQMSY